MFQARSPRISSSSAQNTGTDHATESDCSPSTNQSTLSSLHDTPSQSQSPSGVSPTQRLQLHKDSNEWQWCGCIPVCLPLIALITTPQARFDTKLLLALVIWAYKISWGSFCSEHLMRLARLIPTEGPLDRSRADIIQKLEAFCCSQGSYLSMSTASFSCTTD